MKATHDADLAMVPLGSLLLEVFPLLHEFGIRERDAIDALQ